MQTINQRKAERNKILAWLAMAEKYIRTAPQGSPIKEWEVERAERMIANGWTLQEAADWAGRGWYAMQVRLHKAKAASDAGTSTGGK